MLNTIAMRSHKPEYWLEKIRALDSEAVEVLNEYFKRLENKTLSERRKVTYCYAVYNLLRLTGKKLKSIKPEDIEDYLTKRLDSGRSLRTVQLEYDTLRKFFRETRGLELKFKFPKERKQKFEIDPKQFLSDAEFERLLKTLKHPRDKALVMLLRETGARIGEILGLNVGDVEINQEYAKLHIRQSKTAEREIVFVKAIPYVKTWILNHPNPKPNNPLFVKLRRGKIERLTYEAVWLMLKRALKEAGIKKRVHPHLFRHMVATELMLLEKRGGISPVATEKYLGWVIGTRMRRRYGHVTQEEANAQILAGKYGKFKKEEEEPKGLVECPRCSRYIEAKYKYCPHCGQALNFQEAFRIQEIKQIQAEFWKILAENPELLEELKKLVRQRHKG